ncbi:subtilisin-like protease SBT2.5 isoform X2 [Chenopodium quinoa]|uniref:subtilisin-like protease SBT2.5 isoform X2 n=1 Tax=Chenopodium quinoa TaxID=63459 RepID=UPI000B76D881|nr:subtilisin-like protease SBT2.5 isoform X2 [Chenopodium quinoa]
MRCYLPLLVDMEMRLSLAVFFLISCSHMLNHFIVHAEVFMVLMEGDSFVSRTSYQGSSRNYDDIKVHKEMIDKQHDVLLETLLDSGSYTKLYSYSHLLNGFAIHVTSKKAVESLRNATGVRAIHEDMKMEKLTTHTPDYLGIPTGVWPSLGGARSSGEGMVIGLIDTGINPNHPSFSNLPSLRTKGSMDDYSTRFKGKCSSGERFPFTACNGKIVGAQYFARAAIAAGDFNATRDYASPYDADGHGSHTASTAAGNYETPVIVNGFNYGNASGMAPGASIAVYKALYTFGGYMSDVVAAVDQAVEDGVDVLSLSVGPSSVPPGPSAFLNVLEMELLFATKAGVVVIQAAGNGGPSSSSILSFSPWITTVAASIIDRKYNSSIVLGNGHSLSGMGLAPPTPGEALFPIASAADVSRHNASIGLLESCQTPDVFIPSLVRGKLVICTYTFDFEFDSASIIRVAETIRTAGAAGFVMTMDPDVGSEEIKGTTVTLGVPGIVLNNLQASTALWQYYNSRTYRGRTGRVLAFGATARILDGRQAIYTGQAPIVASYSSRGPDVNNALLQTADVLKPTIMAPGSSIWAAWSPDSEGDHYAKGQNFALVSGTSMATPHVAGIAALIKHRHPNWKPSAIISAMMTTTDISDKAGNPIMAQKTNQIAPGTPFDYGAGSINPTRAVDPGIVFIAKFKNYVQFLCAVPGVDDESVRRAVGVGCPPKKGGWCSDLNTPTITISNLVGSRKVVRVVSNVGEESETYTVTVRPPMGVRVKVSPKSFTVSHNATRQLKIVLEATDATNNYSFGEMLLRGDKGHLARVPITVLVSSVLGNGS